MAAYDYRCLTCEETFEVRRSIAAADQAAHCPAGHADVTRVWTAVALAGGGARTTAVAGGCCGGGCCG